MAFLSGMPPQDSTTSNVEGESGQRSAGPNMELDSFAYIETLLESLACLGKLGVGVDTISQRLQVEMFNLVETTVGEVEER